MTVLEPIKTMKLYTQVARVFNELRELGIDDDDPIRVADLLPFDQYHYEGVTAVEEAIHACAINATKRVLEVGAGIGGPARYLADRVGCRVTALELQADLHAVGAQLTERCGLARYVAHRHSDFLDEHAAALDYTGHDSSARDSSGAAYDTLVSWLAFLHIPDRQRLFDRCMAVLKPGGYLYIEDFSKRGEFSPAELADLASKVYCRDLPTQPEYVAQVMAAGFGNVQVTDMTEPWTCFVRQRYDAFCGARARHMRVHGAEIVDGLDDFFATMAQLYEGGNLGGLRLVAQKPLDYTEQSHR